MARLHRGDWPNRLIKLAQGMVAIGAAMALVAVLTLNPFALIGFAALQLLLIGGAALFIAAAFASQRAMVMEQFAAGQTIFEEGDPGQHIFVIKSGWVEVLQRQRDGSRQVVDRLGPGDHFGDLALIRRSLPRRATVIAATPIEVCRMNPGGFVALYTNLPELRDYLRRHEEPHLRKLAARGWRLRRKDPAGGGSDRPRPSR